MARVLNSISLDAPTSDPNALVGATFSFDGTPGFSGTGGVQRYDFYWQVDDGGGYVTIAASGTGLTTADTNPLVNTNSATQNSITVTCSAAGTYTVRMAGASTSGGAIDTFSSTQAVTVTALEINADAGAYSISGTDLVPGIGLIVSAGSYSLSGSQAALETALSVSAGSYSINGQDASLDPVVDHPMTHAKMLRHLSDGQLFWAA